MSLEDCLENIKTYPVPSNERTAEYQMVVPILEALGWSFNSPFEISLGYKLKHGMGNQVDVALRHSDRAEAIIKVAKPGTITTDLPRQLIEEAIQEDAEICILTNGIEWLLSTSTQEGKFGQTPLVRLDIKNEDVRRLKSKFYENLHAEIIAARRNPPAPENDAEAQLDKEATRKALQLVLSDIFFQPPNEFLDLIGQELREKHEIDLNVIQTQEALAEYTTRQIVPIRELQEGDTTVKPGTNSKRRRRNKPTPVPSHINLWGVRHRVDSHKDVLVIVAEKLYEENPSRMHDAMTLRGSTVYYLTTNPGDMSLYFRLKSSGLFVRCNLSGKDMHKRAREFLTFFGHKASDLKLEYPKPR